MLRRLEAEESLRVANTVAYGFGSMKDGDGWARRLHAQMRGEDTAAQRVTPQAAAVALGIPIVRGADGE